MTAKAVVGLARRRPSQASLTAAELYPVSDLRPGLATTARTLVRGVVIVFCVDSYYSIGGHDDHRRQHRNYKKK